MRLGLPEIRPCFCFFFSLILFSFFPFFFYITRALTGPTGVQASHLRWGDPPSGQACIQGLHTRSTRYGAGFHRSSKMLRGAGNYSASKIAAKGIKHKYLQFLWGLLRNFFKIAFIWDQSGICSSNRLEMRAILRKTIMIEMRVF